MDKKCTLCGRSHYDTFAFKGGYVCEKCLDFFRTDTEHCCEKCEKN